MNKVCPACETINSPDSIICSKCGSTFTVAGRTLRISPEEQSRQSGHSIDDLIEEHPHAFIFYMEGYESPLIVGKGHEVMAMGRYVPGNPKPAIDLAPFGGGTFGVSRNHANIVPIGRGYGLQDLNSTNGTWLNGGRLMPHTPSLLHSGDRIRLGQFTMMVYFAEEEMFDKYATSRLTPMSETSEIPTTPAPPAESPKGAKTVSVPPQNNVVPFLRAVGDLQHIIDEILEQDHYDITMKALIVTKQPNVVSINLEITTEAIEFLRKIVLPWKKKNQEIITQRTSQLKERQFQLAIDLVRATKPILTDEEQKQYTQKLMPVILALTFADVEIIFDERITH